LFIIRLRTETDFTVEFGQSLRIEARAGGR
jgi:hypothetical protein